MVRSRIAFPHSTAIVSPIRTSSSSGIGISSYVFDEDVGRERRKGFEPPVGRPGNLVETEFVGMGAGGGADYQGLDGASLDAVGAGGDDELAGESVVTFEHGEIGFLSLGRPRPGPDVSDDAEDAASWDRDLDGEVRQVDRAGGGVVYGRRSAGVAEHAFGDLVHLVGGDDLAGDKVRHGSSSLSCKPRGFAQNSEVGVLEHPEGGGEGLGVVEAEGDGPVRGGDVVANPHHVSLPLGFPAAGFDTDGEAVTEAGVPNQAVAVL